MFKSSVRQANFGLHVEIFRQGKPTWVSMFESSVRQANFGLHVEIFRRTRRLGTPCSNLPLDKPTSGSMLKSFAGRGDLEVQAVSLGCCFSHCPPQDLIRGDICCS